MSVTFLTNEDKELIDQQIRELSVKTEGEVGKLNEEIADLKENGTGTGSGLNTTSQALLRQLLEATVYDSDVLPQPQTVIDAFFNSLSTGGGSDEPVEPDEPDVQYTITNNLTNCTNSNSLASIEKGSNYTAVISANEGYELETVTVTHGGASVTATNGVITIASVIGDIVITANAVEQSNDVVLYSIKDKDCNKYLGEPTGLLFGSDSANGALNAWTITVTAERRIDGRIIICLVDSNGNTNANHMQLFVDSYDTIFKFMSQKNVVTPFNLQKGSMVITKDAGIVNELKLYYVSNGEVVCTTLDGSTNDTRLWLNGTSSNGELYVGPGPGKEGFTGIIHDFTITLGKVYSEEEIASYLGV